MNEFANHRKWKVAFPPVDGWVRLLGAWEWFDLRTGWLAEWAGWLARLEVEVRRYERSGVPVCPRVWCVSIWNLVLEVDWMDDLGIYGNPLPSPHPHLTAGMSEFASSLSHWLFAWFAVAAS